MTCKERRKKKPESSGIARGVGEGGSSLAWSCGDSGDKGNREKIKIKLLSQGPIKEAEVWEQKENVIFVYNPF